MRTRLSACHAGNRFFDWLGSGSLCTVPAGFLMAFSGLIVDGACTIVFMFWARRCLRLHRLCCFATRLHRLYPVSAHSLLLARLCITRSDQRQLFARMWYEIIQRKIIRMKKFIICNFDLFDCLGAQG
jgi:hypothetical protein